VLDEPNTGLLEAPNAPPPPNTEVFDMPNALPVLPKVGVVVEPNAGVLVAPNAGVLVAPKAECLLNQMLVGMKRQKVSRNQKCCFQMLVVIVGCYFQMPVVMVGWHFQMDLFE
jgi:hypothetical protein